MSGRNGFGYSSLPDRLQGIGAQQWEVHYRARELEAAGREVLVLSIGEPDFDTPSPIIEKAAEAMRAGRTKYSAVGGEPELIDALAARYSERAGRDVGTDQVIFTPGSHTALNLIAQALLEPGDELLMPEPFYAAYSPVFALTGATVVHVPLEARSGFRLSPREVKERITPRTKALVLNNPHNPTGALIPPDTVADITRVCVDNGVWVISDEVYESLVYDGVFQSPFDIDDYADGVVLASSLSKSHSMTGWRCGWAVGSRDVMARVGKINEAIMFGAQPFLQDAAAYALTEDHDSPVKMRNAYRRRAELVIGLLDESDVVRCHRPEAGIFVMADISPTGLSGADFATALLEEESVATMPGESFGPSGAGYLRISLTAEDDILREGCKRIRSFAERL